jgi:hypothetical protein
MAGLRWEIAGVDPWGNPCRQPPTRQPKTQTNHVPAHPKWSEPMAAWDRFGCAMMILQPQFLGEFRQGVSRRLGIPSTSPLPATRGPRFGIKPYRNDERIWSLSATGFHHPLSNKLPSWFLILVSCKCVDDETN